MKRFTSAKYVLSVMLIALLAGAPAVAGPQGGKGNPEKGQKQQGQKGQKSMVQKGPQHQGGHSAASVAGLISVSDARRLAVTHNYVGYQPLPPGIRKKLARGQPLPPGIARKMAPNPMLTDLPVRSGYVWYVYGRNLVLGAVTTGIIADVLFDVFE